MATHFQLDTLKCLVTFLVMVMALLIPFKYTEGVKCYSCSETTNPDWHSHTKCIGGGVPPPKPGSPDNATEEICNDGCLTTVQYSQTERITGVKKGCLDDTTMTLISCLKKVCRLEFGCIVITDTDVYSTEVKKCYKDSGRPLPKPIGRSEERGDNYPAVVRSELPPELITKLCDCQTDHCNERFPKTSSLASLDSFCFPRGSTVLKAPSSKVIGIGLLVIVIFSRL